jgi:ribulose-5-phosphate 4-epimerase/fuculose-1-phosphate aldolase
VGSGSGRKRRRISVRKGLLCGLGQAPLRSRLGDLRGIIEGIAKKAAFDEGYIKFNCIFKKTQPPAHTKELIAYRQKLYDYKLIGAYPNKVGYGNISIRTKNTILITGSATGNFKRINKTHISRITDYDIEGNNLHCTGGIKASSESMTHATLYECSDEIGAVIHVHNLAMWNRWKDRIPTTSKKATYGTPEMARAIQRLYKKTDFKTKGVAVMGGHKKGLIAFGKNLEEAYQRIIALKGR